MRRMVRTGYGQRSSRWLTAARHRRNRHRGHAFACDIRWVHRERCILLAPDSRRPALLSLSRQCLSHRASWGAPWVHKHHGQYREYRDRSSMVVFRQTIHHGCWPRTRPRHLKNISGNGSGDLMSKINLDLFRIGRFAWVIPRLIGPTIMRE